ncbi:MAG: heparan-alpha-glucosaminide N-acetyltransferase domain-containing protein [Bryobacteraceae bacterium]
MKRFPFLDWMRGVAVIVMIECHTFNSLTRLGLRDGGPYVLSQFVGGMAAPLFLFMAGMTSAFQMDGLDRREANPLRRWRLALHRAGYILAIAFAFRITNWLGSFPGGNWHEIFKVDILNCMGVAMAFFAAVAGVERANRARVAAMGAMAIALVSPVLANLNWDGAPVLLREYMVPIPGRGHFPFFPCAAYLGFGLAAGAVVKQTAEQRMERLMQWSVLAGFGLVFGGQYFANLPYSIYAKSSFWSDSPALVLIRLGMTLVLMPASYLWTEYWTRAGWSWVVALGRNSLMVYWVHVVLVYGALAKPFKRTMNIPEATLATSAVMALMVALSVAWLQWKSRRGAVQPADAIPPAPASAAAALPESG